jgi:hypothetical protein
METDVPDIQDDVGLEDPPPTRPGLLLLAAAVVIVIPVLIAFYFLRNTGSDTASIVGDTPAGQTAGMGGGMGGSDTDSESSSTDVAAVVADAEGVGDFTEIQATDIIIEPDSAGDGAVLRVVTSLDVACAVSYGPTAELGSIATDTDMAGGGHTNHQPLMVGLEAGKTYSYQVSAIAPDGALYQSELMQFTYEPGAAAAQAVAPPADNVAHLARVSDVSSEYSEAFAGANAIDGDRSTEWSSAGDGDDAYIVVEFVEDMRIEGVGFRTREMTDGTSITTSFTATVNGRVYGPFEAGPGLSIGLFDTVGTVVRVDVETSTGGNTGAIEIEVYGQTDM